MTAMESSTNNANELIDHLTIQYQKARRRLHKPITLLHCYIVTLLHCYFVALLHCSIIALLHCSTVALLHCCTVAFLHYCSIM